MTREISEWDIVTLAEMVAGLKTKSAARFASERTAGTSVTPAEMLEAAGDLLSESLYENNPKALFRLINEARNFLA
jgi:hypothetical protein